MDAITQAKTRSAKADVIDRNPLHQSLVHEANDWGYSGTWADIRSSRLFEFLLDIVIADERAKMSVLLLSGLIVASRR